ncbi:MAG: hypothetical protein PSV36_09490 [Algoriphagus sp.]|nr:hypothetical protein [Algoriphagus sp.]
MELAHFQKPTFLKPTSKLAKKAEVFERLLEEMKSRNLPKSIIEFTNQELLLIDGASSNEKTFAKQLKKSQTLILKLLEKELKIVPKNYYLTIYMSLGMAAFGIPIGVAFGLSLGNLAFLGIGLPIGMAIGTAIGTAKDSKAKASGNQLEVEIIY